MAETLTLAPAVAGFSRPGIALVAELGLGIVKVQIDRGEPTAALAALVGPLPEPRRMTTTADVAVAWLAPGEWLLMDEIPGQLVQALTGQVALVTDLSHARAAFRLIGADARDALAAHCPLDLSDRAFPVGAAARSLLSDSALFVARLPDADGAPAFRLIVDQTMAAYAVKMIEGPTR